MKTFALIGLLRRIAFEYIVVFTVHQRCERREWLNLILEVCMYGVSNEAKKVMKEHQWKHRFQEETDNERRRWSSIPEQYPSLGTFHLFPRESYKEKIFKKVRSSYFGTQSSWCTDVLRKTYRTSERIPRQGQVQDGNGQSQDCIGEFVLMSWL